MTNDLAQTFTEEEVSTSFHQMNLTKALGPIGMVPIFFQKYWNIFGKSVIFAVLQALNNVMFTSSIYHPFITLIPKKKKPEIVSDYRPISLCNVIYRLISKVLAIRFKLILPHVTSNSQNAFVSDRLITDNILVAYEIIHFLR